ncbi:phospholipid-transporting ATPase ABCA1-like isoform X3 [Convolutriloba macropyga]|uniref:phospholipid-transporting ATPase ABCA1-like isoform X3 n=1 Tax=Convolutriloba macropyga TaxID=536237 RepID=UPI003F528BF4
MQGNNSFYRANTLVYTGRKLHCSQIRAIMSKNFRALINLPALVILVLFPVMLFLIAVTLFSLAVVAQWAFDERVELHPWLYGKKNLILYEDSAAKNLLMTRVGKGIVNKPYFSTACVKGKDEKYSETDKFCDKTSESSGFRQAEILSTNKRSSEDGIMHLVPRAAKDICSIEDGPPAKCKSPSKKPKKKTLSTGDTLLNMKDIDISDYVLRTRMDDRFKLLFGFVLFDENSNPYTYYKAEDSKQAVESFKNFLNNSPYLNYTALGWSQIPEIPIAEMFPQQGVTIWWENKALQVLAIAVNSINNVILRATMKGVKGKENSADGYSIVASLHSWIPYYYDYERDLYVNLPTFIMMAFICFVFSLVLGYFVYFLVWDRSSGCKHLKNTSGVSTILYWLANFLFQFLILFVVCILCSLAMLAITKVPFMPSVLLLMFLFAIAVLPSCYVFVPFFNNPGTAMVVMRCVVFLQGFGFATVTMCLDVYWPDVGKVVKPIFLLSPTYALCGGIMEIFFVSYKQERYDEAIGMLDISGLGLFLLFLVIDAVFYTLILFIVEFVLKKVKSSRERKTTAEAFGMSARDMVEESIFENAGRTINAVDVKNISKSYQPTRSKCRKGKCERIARDKYAVKNISFSIPPWTCLYLFGDTDSGKTTITHILTGKTEVSNGKVLIQGEDLTKFYRANRNRTMIGFCPEHDEALHSFFKVKQELLFYARIRGLKGENIPQVIEWLLNSLDLKENENTKIGKLSVDEWRRISVAIALIGNAKILIIDEPFANLSPKATYLITRILRRQVSSAKSLLVTSRIRENIGDHEDKSLIDSFMILSENGVRFRGDRQKMANAEGDFFLATIVLNDESFSGNVRNAFLLAFPNSVLLEIYPKFLLFKLPKDGLDFNNLFDTMDYSSGRRKNRDANFAGIKNFFLSDPNVDELAKYALTNPYKHDEDSKQNLDKNGNADSPGIELPIHKNTENSEAPEENGGKMDTTEVIVDDSTSADKSKGGKSKSPKSANTSGSPDRSKVKKLRRTPKSANTTALKPETADSKRDGAINEKWPNGAVSSPANSSTKKKPPSQNLPVVREERKIRKPKSRVQSGA